MNRQYIQQIIRELFRQNFNAYPENYPLTEEGLMSEEGTICAQEVAKGYWDAREEAEIERDENAGVTEIDYVEWVMSALSGLIPAAHATIEKAANHFLELYKDDLTNADAQVAENTIHEWWGMTEDQYEGVEYEDIKEAIMKELSSPNKFQTWAAEINKDWNATYKANATEDTLSVKKHSAEVARIDYNSGRYTVTGTDKDAVESLNYMVNR